LGGWRFDDRKGCLRGTREHFLDRISQWIENPGSQRGLVLIGKAGTGKSSIAHEIARHFDVKCLGSYVAFRRTENSRDVGCRLFAKLAHDLSVRYPPFKRALKRAMTGDSSLRGTRDYPRLFERLLRKPLENLRLGDTILVIIDGLDESGLTIGKNGPHSFLAQRLIELPSNFRVLITSRPEHGIETTFANAESVGTLYMDDAQLAADTMQDISLYLQDELPEDVFKSHGGRLMESSEGFFQWAAVACGFINSTRLDLGDNECVQRLLGHSRGLSGQGLLDNLYEQVLKEYFKTDSSQVLFRSVMGQLFAAIEPLSIDTLISLRRHSLAAHPEDSDRVLIMLPYLGSLLSNVISSDRTRPIVPIHTSFRDFLTSRTSTEFYVDLADAHRQLVHSCLGIMLDNLKFNICKLESSYLANSDVPDLETRIAKHIPSALSYACIHWNNHLEHLAFDEDIFKKVRSVFETRFLFWLEVLSIKSHLGLASRALSSLLIWLQREVCTLQS
jgi:NACHT domain